MDPAWIDECNRMIDRHAAEWEEQIESGPDHPSPKQAGTPRLYLNNLFKLPSPDCARLNFPAQHASQYEIH